MNSFFKRLPLYAKLMLVGLLPLALLIYFTLQIYNEKTDKLSILKNYLNRVEQVSNINNLISELQSERRYSFGYALTQQWRSELVVQRPKTDAALQRLHANNDTQYLKVESYTFLDSLQAVRQEVDSRSLTASGTISFFNNAIFRLNTLNAINSNNLVFLQPVAKELAGQKLLSEMITDIGRVRANIYYQLYTHSIVPSLMENTRNFNEIYKSYETEFFLKSTPASIAAYKQMVSSGSLHPVMKTVDDLFKYNRIDSTSNAEKWWTISATAVDEMKTLQLKLLNDVQSGISASYEKERSKRTAALIYLLLSIVVVIVFVSYIISLITKSLESLNEAAQKISLGATGLQIRKESDDVIGNLAQSMLRIDSNNKALATAADAIGSGRFEVPIVPRSSEDILGNAILRMKNDLQQFNKENQEKLWVLGGVELVNDHLRGDKDVNTLATDALDALTTYVNGEVGLVYITKDNFLRYAGGYAVSGMESIPRELKYGETLLGQAAEKARIMQLDNVPEEFIKIKTATGQIKPKNILLIPFVHEGKVEGVAEIGAIGTFNEAALPFLQQVAPAIAIALQSAKSRERLQELFEETQAQSEELQAQHSELENINSELEAQSEKLQASEEELKVQQEELMHANQELEERSRLLEERNQVIVERNLEIQKTAEELELSTRYKSEFLANMSHELRTPLNSILLLSRLLSENSENNLSSDQVEYAQVIQTSGNGLLSLIDEILDLSKIEAGKMDLEYQPVSINEVVHDMQALFDPIAKDRRLDLVVQVAENTPSQIETDKMRLEQVLKNLLSNALKFTSKGSVTLSVRPLPENDLFLAFSVKDTGIGIPQDKQHLVFEAFQQADGSTRRKYGGTGLGLSISRELAKLLGGEIKLTSEVNKGSEFTVYLPIHKIVAKDLQPQKGFQADTEKIQDATEASKPMVPVYKTENIPEPVPDDRSLISTKDKTILIIEDDTAFARALLDFAHKKGYKALVAVRGDEGIELALQFRPVGILLDLQLPVKDGWEVMEALKSNSQTRHIPVHIMSSMEAKKESLHKGAIDFINKPIAFEQLQEVFKKIEQVVMKENKKVLIVEENAKHAKALAYFLEAANVNAHISGTIDQGVENLQKKEVDCVILDMGIPDQKAYETLDALKKSAGMENLPIIIFTGKNLSKSEEGKIRQYADSIVVKTAHSFQRILDEVSLFLHLVEENTTNGSQPAKYRRLGALNEVLATKKVLVVDDDVRNIFSLTKALEQQQMKVLSAVDGKEALQVLNENPDMDVVLMDIMMPEMDGYQAIQEIRRNNKFRNLPVIAVTAKAMTGDREKCIKAGASDYISKPVDVDQLLSLLRVWLYDKSM
ncbi:MAG TPA: response regulator [Flavisolibacter sp.]|nr:response regulator [Flavisolibacter sp.]